MENVGNVALVFHDSNTSLNEMRKWKIIETVSPVSLRDPNVAEVDKTVETFSFSSDKK
jgi:hypothetical protein